MDFMLKLERSDNESDRKALYDAVCELCKISTAVCCFPSNPTYRQVILDSNLVLGCLLPVDGAMECLFEMGFEEGQSPGFLQLPLSTDILKIQEIRRHLRQKKQKLEAVSFNDQSYRGNRLIQELIHRHRNVHSWLTDEGISNLSYKEIPHEFLKRHCDREKKKAEKAVPREIFNEELTKLQFLVTWFKHEFYEWVDQPFCPRCRIRTVIRPSLPANPSHNYRVEHYQCGKCGRNVEFPRYTDPEKLLETRKGRCGEWAISFTHMCRALGLDARIVYDETDHVWTEVFLHLDYKWVHCDPCEGIIDSPLIYEAGWKKRLSYIFAYSPDEIQDVSWRYSSHHDQLIQRRNHVSEIELAKFLTEYRVACLEKQTEQRRNFVTKRCAQELAVLLLENSPEDEELEGRTSGALDWRLSRGETMLKKHVWKISGAAIKNNEWIFGYSITKDCYFVAGEPITQKWNTGLAENQDIFRKVEKDWQMVYFARREGADKGHIMWSFQLDDKFVVDKIVIDWSCAVYETGNVKLTLSSDAAEIPVPENHFETSALKGCRLFHVKGSVCGGVGDTAWQHAQLFRQKLSDSSIPFKITVRVREV